MKVIYRLILPVLFLFFVTGSQARQVTAKQNGPWKQAATWLNGYLPTNGDTITIPVTVKVVISTQEDYTGSSVPLRINVYGELNFQNGKKLIMPPGSVVEIHTGGTVSPGSGGGSSNLIEIGSQVVWTAAVGPLNGYAFLPSVPLPVELLYFRAATVSNGHVKLEWSTASEVNNDYFFVEKSNDGMLFNSIAIIEGHGTTSAMHYYSYTDIEVTGGEYIYYRLKQRDYDGKNAYSEIIVVRPEKNPSKEVRVYPNPSQGILYLGFDNTQTYNSCNVQMYDARGNIVLDKNFNAVPGSKNLMLSDQQNTFSPGMYSLRIVVEDEVLNRQVVIW